MTGPDLRCSVLSSAREESMAGTAFTRGGLLLVEQPGAWGRGGLDDSDFDADVAAVLQERAGERDLKVFAIRRPGRTEQGRARRWAVRLPGFAQTLWGEFTDDEELLGLALDGSVGAPDPEPFYLVCTHAKRDECCAVFGRRIEAALDTLRPGRVWGCSHTGGHRFAPIVLAVPGVTAGAALYGRVLESDLADLVTATDSGRTLPGRLRGQIGFPPIVQAALAHAQAQTSYDGFADWQPATVTTGPGAGAVDLTGPDGRHRVEVSVSIDETPYPSCGKPGPEPQEHLVVTGFRRLGDN